MLGPVLREHFKNPRGVGRLARASGSGSAENAGCGDVVTIEAQVVAGSCTAIGFLAQGCQATVASASYISERFRGRPLTEIAAADPDHILVEIEESSAAARHGMAMALRALRTACGLN